MRRFVLLIFVLRVALPGVAASVSTNIAVSVASVASPTNVPVANSIRRQCEAGTKSGNRCKRNAVPGATLCRQHQKISSRQSEVRVRDVPVPHK